MVLSCSNRDLSIATLVQMDLTLPAGSLTQFEFGFPSVRFFPKSPVLVLNLMVVRSGLVLMDLGLLGLFAH